MLALKKQLADFDPETGEIDGAVTTNRYLSDLRGCFADAAAYVDAVSIHDTLLYKVTSVEPGSGDGDLHYGVGVLMPGRIGREYFMTKGHLHVWRDAAEVYIGLRGEGVMLLEDESGDKGRLVSLCPNQIVYVPGHTAHRTINIGKTPLCYIGVYPARAGHDYSAIAARNFHHVVLEHGGKPVMLKRNAINL
jgi:glucose-6-phosphate isomerase, archaeal